MNNIHHKKKINIGIVFANLVFLAIAFFFFFILLFASYRVYSNLNNIYSDSLFNFKFYILCIALSLIIIILLKVLYFRLKKSTKVNLSILLFIIGFSFFAFEIYLYLPKKSPCGYDTRCNAAKKLGISYDKRSLIDVIQDFHNQKQKVYPNYSPRWLLNLNGLSLDNDKDKIFPLGGISNITTIFNNESGYFPIIETDEHGFNNPKGLYDKGQKDMVLLGDSFVEGEAVKTDENMSAAFRKLGFDGLNFAKGGSGTLSQFATLKEYAIYHRPKTVLWFYYGNDIKDLEREMESDLLMNYLNYQDYNQNLMSKQNEIDKLLIDYFAVVEENWNQKFLFNKTSLRILKFSFTRKKIKSIFKKYKRQINKEVKQSIEEKHKIIVKREKVFKKILVESKKYVETWGGKIYFIFLPTFVKDTTGNELKFKRYGYEYFGLGEEEKYRQFIYNALIKEDIQFIDMWDVISVHRDPQSFCPLRRCGHYNAEGYRFVAETISKRLKNDGIIPSEFNN